MDDNKTDPPDGRQKGQDNSQSKAEMSVTEKTAIRDAWVRSCVEDLKMKPAQIHSFSQGWPFPFYDEKGVRRRITALRLKPNAKKQSLHERLTLDAIAKIWGDCIKSGLCLREGKKEIAVTSGLRADMGFKLNRFTFYLESQRYDSNELYSKLSRWADYRKTVVPFRVLLVGDSEIMAKRILERAKEVMKGQAKTLFYVSSIQTILSNSALSPYWITDKEQLVALL